ncbi:MAG: sulfoxide reductase heme-binding subunit YedZ [Geminicoccaceae bacterium]|nr:MAG: sulfoxide reductase heme-binding subunit YedZ [Geminicoccaceae bacterium]
MSKLVGWLVTLGGALPGLWLLWQWQTGGLGVVPDEVVLHKTGRFGLVFLVATLALGPLQALSRWRPLLAARRPLGLWCFAYVLAHAGIWAWLDQGLFWEFIWAELTTMLHLQLGLAALLLLLPLALTSTNAALKALTFRRWQRLHLLVWPAAVLAIVHAWMVQRFESPLVVGLAAAVLVMLTTRLAVAWRQHRRSGA